MTLSAGLPLAAVRFAGRSLRDLTASAVGPPSQARTHQRPCCGLASVRRACRDTAMSRHARIANKLAIGIPIAPNFSRFGNARPLDHVLRVSSPAAIAIDDETKPLFDRGRRGRQRRDLRLPSSATFALNSAVNRLRVLMVDRPFRRRIHHSPCLTNRTQTGTSSIPVAGLSVNLNKKL
jgi:hypothetical protein